MSELAYLNLDLLVERAEPHYRVRVVASPAGESRPASFRVPFSDLEVENFLLKIGRPRRNVRRINTPQVTAIKDFGGRLFDAVFPPELRVNLAISQSRADAEDAGLRIRLRFSECPELSELPWEYLYDREHNRFLCLSDRTPLVRYLEVSDPVRVVPVTLPLRILVVIASPSDLQQLDSDQEWRNVTAALSELKQRRRVEVDRLAEPTLSALQRQLRRNTYHIFHFIGHGGFDPGTQDGMLAMEDDHGRSRLVAGDELGTLLHDHRSLRMAVLNSCEGARGDHSDPFSGTAQSLIQQGIPAVVAMQFEITDDAAITFGNVLYEAIADGYPLDAATTEARKAIYADDNLTEWGTPVLYLRAPDGRIFDIEDRLPPVLPPSSAQQAQREAEQQARREAEQRAAEQQVQPELEQLYDRALAAFWTEQWDEAVDLLGQILSRRPGYADATAKLDVARRQQELASDYAQASAAADAGDWEQAVAKYSRVAEADADYRDANGRLAEARQQHELVTLQAEAERLHRAGQWAAVIKVGEQLQAINPAAADPEGLLTSARAELAAQQRAAALAADYDNGLRLFDAGRWEEAVAAFERVTRLDSTYEDVAALLDRSRRELEKARRNQRLFDLDDTAERAVQAGRWDEAVEALEAIVALQPSDDVTDRLAQARLKQQVTELRNDVLALAETGDWAAVLAADAKLAKLDPETSDPEGLATKARATLLEAELGGLYTDGVKQLDEHDWTGAEATFRGLLDRRAGYRDVDELVALAQRRGRPTEEKHVQLGPVHPDSATRGGGSQPAHVRTVLASSSDAVGNRHRRVRLSPSRVGLLLLAAVLLAAGLVLTGLALSRIRPEAPSSHPTAAPVTSTTPTSPVCGFVEEFDGATLAEAWQRTRPDATVKLAAGTAELAAPDGADIYEDHLKAPMLLREVTGDFVLETDVTTSPHQFYQGAGLVLRSGPENYVRLERGFVFLSGIGFEYKDGGDHIRVRSPRRGPEKVQTDAKRVVLQLTRKGQTISARWRPFNEPGFTELGRITVRFPDTIRVGISVLNRAQSGAKPTSFRARFEHVALSC